MNYTEMLFNRDERLVNLLNQADSKNLELIVELNDREEEIERLSKLLDKTRLSELHKEYVINELEKWLDEESEKTILSTGHLTCLMMCKNKLQELKGEGSNENFK